MKKLLTLLLCWGMLAGCQITPEEKEKQIAEETMGACCTKKRDFAGLMPFTHDLSFIAAHDEPIAFEFKSQFGGEKITFDCPDGQKANAFFIKSAKKSNKYLFVFHEWWGLNEHIMKESEKYYAALGNVNIIAIDLYDGQVATTREDAAKYMQGAKPERLKAIVQGAITYVGEKAKIATVGWCFGGGMSLQASILAQAQSLACVIYYGMPEKDTEKLKNLQAEVLGIFAGKEKWINTEVVKEFETNLTTLGKKFSTKIYDAEHAFANPSNPNYNQAFADEAFEMSINFIKQKLK